MAKITIAGDSAILEHIKLIPPALPEGITHFPGFRCRWCQRMFAAGNRASVPSHECEVPYGVQIQPAPTKLESGSSMPNL
jgi:hypothetical protein